MNLRILFFSTVLLFLMTNLFGQDKLVLVHKTKPHKKKYLNFDREYHIKTLDTTYTYRKIVDFSDTTLSIITQTKTDRDTSYTYSYKISKHKDTSFSYTQPLYKQDTIIIPFSAIQTIQKDWFKNRRWLEGFAWLSLGTVLAVPLLPVAVIDKGSEGLREWLTFEAIIIGICAPPLLIGTRKTKYDLSHKWVLKAER